MELTLYDDPISGNGYKMRLLLARLGIPYRLVELDIALYAHAHVAQEGRFDMSGYPNIADWLDRVRAEPGYVAMGARP